MNSWHKVLALAAEYYRRGAAARARSYAAERGVSAAVFDQGRLGEGGDDRGLRARIPDELRGPAQDLGLIDRVYGLDRMRGRLVFPVHDVRGRVVAITGRDHTGKARLRYLTTTDFPGGGPKGAVYGLWQARDIIRKVGCAVLVEGPLDLMVAWSYGWRNAISTLGLSITARQLDLIARATGRVKILLDEPGPDENRNKFDEVVQQIAQGLRDRCVKVGRLRLPPGEDPASYFHKKMVRA
jgi:DNA primase